MNVDLDTDGGADTDGGSIGPARLNSTDESSGFKKLKNGQIMIRQNNQQYNKSRILPLLPNINRM